MTNELQIGEIQELFNAIDYLKTISNRPVGKCRGSRRDFVAASPVSSIRDTSDHADSLYDRVP